MKRHIKPVRCPECEHTTAERRDMVRHMQSIHKLWVEEHGVQCSSSVCRYCGKDFTLKHNLVKHLKKKH